jgi:hypothetical protein
MTTVIFRKWHNGDVIALFPHVDFDRLGHHCSSYEHIGQHGGANYYGVIANTKSATPSEYAALCAELKNIGYELKIAKRARRNNSER